MKQSTVIAGIALLLTGLSPAMVGLVWLVRINLKQVFLRVAGFVVGGVKDDLGVVAAVSLVVLASLWVVIVARAVYELRCERTAVQASRRADETA